VKTDLDLAEARGKSHQSQTKKKSPRKASVGDEIGAHKIYNSMKMSTQKGGGKWLSLVKLKMRKPKKKRIQKK
jgi:hypothetical protein